MKSEGISVSSPREPRMDIHDDKIDITDTNSDEDSNSMIDDSGNKRKTGIYVVKIATIVYPKENT